MKVLEPISGRPETLTDRVYASLKDAVVTRRLEPGERVTEAGLAKQLSVSKTPVREALLRLEHVGLFQSDGGRVHVVVPSAEAIRDAYELRTALESEAVRLATVRADEVCMEAITEDAERSSQAAGLQDRKAFLALDRRFHLRIASGADSRRLFVAIENVLDLVSALRSRDVPDADASRECAEQHVLVAAAMRDRDQAQAEHHLRNHLRKVQDLVLETFVASGG